MNRQQRRQQAKQPDKAAIVVNTRLELAIIEGRHQALTAMADDPHKPADYDEMVDALQRDFRQLRRRGRNELGI